MTTESKSAFLHFTTEAFAPAEKIAAWREIYGRQFVSTNFEPEARDSFTAEATLRAYQGFGIGSIRMGCSRFYRMRERIKSDDLHLIIMESGRWWSAHVGRELYLGPATRPSVWPPKTSTAERREKGHSSAYPPGQSRRWSVT